ncbi:MAG: FtsX-like permease family protein, partial [Mollicutes bacterium]|nr:FtsX-like permease family protein [Mollicutes bacterium]
MKLLIKSTFRKIRKSYGRFLSVVFIVALGMGFFAGLRETAPTMYDTIENYYDAHELMDVKIISSLGLTKSDVESLKELEYIEKVVPSYSVDTLVKGKPIRVHALEDEINHLTLKKGVLPKNNNECLGDIDFFKLNETVEFVGKNAQDHLKINSCKVVGLINSVLYVGVEKGISSVGNGELESFIFLNRDLFDYDVYTEVYLTAKNTLASLSNSTEYKNHYKLLYDELIKLKPIREAIRYEEILKKATEEINKIQNEVNDKINTSEKELNNSKKTLDKNKNDLEKGKKELSENKILLENKLTENQIKIDEGKKTINDNLVILNNTIKNLGFTWETLSKQIIEIKSNINNLKQAMLGLDPTSIEYQSLNGSLKVLEDNLVNLETIQNNKIKLDTELKNLNNQEITLHEEVNKGLKTISEKENELLINEEKLTEGFVKYNEGVQKLNQEKDKAKDKIEEAKEELKTIEEPIWYLIDREDSNGYTGFYNDSENISSISTIFPAFFILIVALITLNTITRMIEEERTEIGIYKALGYKNRSVTFGYLFYIMLATIIGATIGLLGGYNIIPRVIYGIFRVNYIVPDLSINIKLIPFFIMVGLTIILLISVTMWGCYKELKVVTAELLRPKAPKIGKNIFLERIKILWRKLSFTWKVTVRNIFRYKKRIIMTVSGVAGATALLLAGFGLKDSIEKIDILQFKETIKYDATIYFNKDVEEINQELNNLFETNNIIKPSLIRQESFTTKSNKDKVLNISLIIPENKNNINEYISLKNIKDNKELDIPEHGVLITKRMAELLNVKLDDNIEIRNNNNKLFIVQVKGIVDNYILNYIYMSNNYYQVIFEHDVKYNSVISFLDNQDLNELSTNLIKNENITAVNYKVDNAKTFSGIIKGLNKIVILVIAAATILAFIILYNLTSINVNERIREIATLKVLGFSDKEISTFVYRETIVLTTVGIIV